MMLKFLNWVFKPKFTIRDAERICIARAKSRGATEYRFLETGFVVGMSTQDALVKGAELARTVGARWPGALHDPDKSTPYCWAFLLPVIHPN